MKKPNDYRSRNKVEFDQPESRGWTTIKVLQDIWGKKWGITALNYVAALRPSCIRVTEGEIKTNGIDWRVTVYVDGNDIIESIEQEVMVGCVGYKNAYEMETNAKNGEPCVLKEDGIFSENGSVYLGRDLKELSRKYKNGIWLV